MSQFIIKGGKRLGGEFSPSGNKNATLPMLAAALLTDEPVTLKNVPLIKDVHSMLDILQGLGAEVSLRGHTARICAKGLRKSQLPKELCSKVRSSILFAGPLVSRLGRATLHPPGGDVIGRRRLDTHFDGLRALGVTVTGSQPFRFQAKQVRGADILLDEASVTATENIIMAAVLAKGHTTLFNAACEPHVQDLCTMLNAMGASIEGIGTNRLLIEGVDRLKGVTHTIRPDYIEIGSMIAVAAVTGGELKIPGVHADDLRIIKGGFAKLGIQWSIKDGTLTLPANQTLRVKKDHGAAMPKIEDGIWPSFPSDLMSVNLVVATQARGTVLFFEKLFESRMFFVDRLIEMGAQIVQCDPHRVVVVGPSRLHATHLVSPDIRAGMALLIAALCARGESVIDNAHIIDRGYESIEKKLRALGADIVRVS
jgi:UDP-N-acetylglucosamine 1-carboxyvinyltransferase